MTIEEIRELIALVGETGVAELEVQRGENRVRIRRAVEAPIREFVAFPGQPGGHSGSPPGVWGHGAAEGVRAPAAAAEPAGAGLVLVKSPIVGTFYESSSPGAPPFVSLGDRVQPGKVLCIIESMKLMNEIESEVAGIIESKLVANGKPVEYGEALFAIRPV
ncbi:MAG: acetyl-CoA carboxylase biotin carboxyl carrier protein [Acidobacteria bacterium]|nr:acetyl-CoA carboxylase biotin carboxyl carrier protein [Acidobacteriota bacterium]